MNVETKIVIRDLASFEHVKAQLVAEIGKAELSIKEILELKRDDLVRLDSSCEALVTLLLNGKPVATGELVAVGDELGVRIRELL